jgi:Tfp pilus assembly protein FimT
MKPPRTDEQRGITPVRILLALALCALLPLLAYSAAPAWWSQRGVSIAGKAPDD